jgi:hypothetical protein
LRTGEIRVLPSSLAHGAQEDIAHGSGLERYGKGHKHRAGLNFGDCLSYACAKAHGATLLFKGDDLRTRMWRGRSIVAWVEQSETREQNHRCMRNHSLQRIPGADVE